MVFQIRTIFRAAYRGSLVVRGTSSFMYLRRDRVGDSLGLRWGALLIESQRESSSCICFERSREDL